MSRFVKQQEEKVEKLVRLLQENPTLDVVPMVNNEVCAGDDFAYWMGSWESVRVDEVCHIGERVYFRSIDEDELRDSRGELIYIDEYEYLGEFTDEMEKEVDKKALDYVNGLNWEKVIVIMIGLP